MSTALTTTDERPEWIPEDIWPILKKELVLSKAKVSRRSLGEIARGLGLDESKTRSLYNSRNFKVQMEEAREDLSQSSIAAAYRAGEILHERLNDPVAAAKISARDASIIKKQQSENALNLSNGMVGTPAFSMNFSDIKVLLGQTLEKPVVAEKKVS